MEIYHQAKIMQELIWHSFRANCQEGFWEKLFGNDSGDTWHVRVAGNRLSPSSLLSLLSLLLFCPHWKEKRADRESEGKQTKMREIEKEREIERENKREREKKKDRKIARSCLLRINAAHPLCILLSHLLSSDNPPQIEWTIPVVLLSYG